MKKIFYILFFTFSVSISANAESYPGMVKLVIGTHRSYNQTGDLSQNISDTVVFQFYKNPQDAASAQHLSFYFDWSKIPRKQKIVETDYHNWFSPMQFNDDTTSGYFQINFVCKSQKDDWLEVIVNEKTQQTLWIKKQRFVKFISWDQLSGRKYFVSIQTKTKIYNSPDSSTTAINYSGTDCFEILKVKRNWMQITNQNSELCGNYEKPYLDKVWINFKSADQLFIELTIL